MFSFGHMDQPQFGGVGVMIDPPAVELRIATSSHFEATGSHAERVKQFVERSSTRWGLPGWPACQMDVRAPRDHIGLGVGTQLGLSVAAGLRRFVRLPDLPVHVLAAEIGRGKRSAVGTHGFQYGGLIVDAGHQRAEPVGKLLFRRTIPEEWRIVIVTPENQRGLAGSCEADAFARLPPIPDEVTRTLWQIAERDMLPALDRADCAEFGDAVYRFGQLAGECFSAVQDGPFRNPQIAELVDAIRDYGCSGVGQSSWGPTVFAICASTAQAESLVEWLGQRPPLLPSALEIAVPSNTGTRIEVRGE
jgi:beta-RFAP synthase